MTSNISFRKLLFAEFRQKSYLPIIYAVTFLLALPIAYLMRLHPGGYMLMDNLTDIASEVEKVRISETLAHLGGNGLVAFLLAMAAFGGAIGSFDYLCSKREVDFYHSLAIRRDGLFRVKFLAGWLAGAVPYLVNLLAACLIAIGFRVATRETIPVMGVALLWHLLFYTAVYGITILAMTLTGRRLIGVLLTIFLLFYGPACFAVLQGMKSISFATYVEPPQILTILMRTSPVSLLAAGNGKDVVQIGAASWICMALFAVLPVAVAALLYRWRPSETAGNTYVHPIMNAVIKVATAIPGALAFGFLLSLFGVLGGRGWFVLGALLGAVLIGGVVEVIQSVDVRALWKHWRSGVVILAGVGAILAIFLLDPFGYDRYLPKRDRVQAMALYADEMDKEVTSPNGDQYLNYDMASHVTTQCDAIYALAETGVAEAGRVDAMQRRFDTPYYMSEYADDMAQPYGEQHVEVKILYRVGGVDRYRKYEVPRAALEETVDALTEDAALRELVYQTDVVAGQTYDRMAFYDWNDIAQEEDAEKRLTKEDGAELTRALVNDMRRNSSRTLRGKEPVGTLWLYQSGLGGYRSMGEYYVYDNYDETIAFLGKMRYRLREAVDAAGIAEGTDSVTVDWSGKRYAVTGREAIEQILSNLTQTRYESVDRYDDAFSLELYTGGDSYYIPCRWHDKEAAERLLAGKEIPEDDEETDW